MSPSPTAASLAAADVKVTGAAGTAPVVTFTSPAAAEELTKDDVTVGTGKEVTSLETPLTFHYTGIGAQSGKKFDSSWDRKQPLVYPLSGLIVGWQQGIPGMKEGGRRVLVIPGALAYGANPPSADIAPNETLVFVIDLVKVG